MRIRLCYMAAVICLLLAGCTNTQHATYAFDISKICGEFSASYNQLELRGEIALTEQDVYTIKISSPDELSGLLITFDDPIAISYGTLQRTYEKQQLDENGLIPLFAAAVQDASAGGGLLKQTDDGYTLSGSGYRFTMNTQYQPLTLELTGTLECRMRFDR